MWGDLQCRSNDMAPGIRVIGSNMCKDEGAGNKAKESPNRRHTEGKENVMQKKKQDSAHKQVDPLLFLHFVPRREDERLAVNFHRQHFLSFIESTF